MDAKGLRKLNKDLINAQARFSRAELAMRVAGRDLSEAKAALSNGLESYSPVATSFNVRLFENGRNSVDPNRNNFIQVIKAIREVANLGLKEAKDISDYVGGREGNTSIPQSDRSLILRGVSKDQAENAKKMIEQAGGKVLIDASKGSARPVGYPSAD